MLKYSNFILFFTLLFSTSLTAQVNGDVWTLRECIKRAITENLDYESSRLFTRTAIINREQAYHRPFPSLNINGSYGYNFGRTIDPTSNNFIATNLGFNSLGASVSMPLFTGGQIYNSIRQAKVNVGVAQEGEAAVRRQVIITVARDYLSLLMAMEQVYIAQNQLELSREQLQRVDNLIATGAEAENARLDFVAQVATNEQNLISAKNGVATAKLTLMQSMRLEEPIGRFKVIAPTITDKDWASRPIPEVWEILPEAMEIDPRIKRDSLSLVADKYGINIAQGAYYPTLSLSGRLSSDYSTEGRTITGYKRTTNDIVIDLNGQPVTVGFPTQIPQFEKVDYFGQLRNNFGYGFVVGINIPIYNNYQTRAAVQKAEVRYLQSENQYEKSQWQVRSEVQQVVLNAQAAQRTFVARQKTVQSLKAAYENAQIRYKIGAINTMDLLNAQTAYNQAKRNLITAKYDLIFKLKVIDFYLGKDLRIQ